MSDLIRRKDALQALKEAEPTVWTESDYELGQKNQWSLDILAIECLPSAEPKKGKWERSDDPWKAVCSFAPCKTAICSVCKLDTFDRIDYAKKYYKFCPFCGAKMEVIE